uniref:Non-structural silencing suppressor protein n=1 Tax=Orthotospovirus impatiensnecromaculae TaxID=3052576 RepID=A0A7S5CNC3_9VIRU|nr:Non-structural silencing suppressor protein [Orthotospovirus impatiensnecromaculae]
MSSAMYETIIKSKSSIWGTTSSGKAVVDSYWIHDQSSGKKLVEAQLYSDSRSKTSFCYTGKVGFLPTEEKEIISENVFVPIFDDIDLNFSFSGDVVEILVRSNTTNTNGVKHQGHLKVLSSQLLRMFEEQIAVPEITSRFGLKESDIFPPNNFIEAANKGSLSCVKEVLFDVKYSNNQSMGKVSVLSPTRSVHEWLYTLKPVFNQSQTNNRTVNTLAVKSLAMSATSDLMSDTHSFVRLNNNKPFKISLWMRIPKIMKSNTYSRFFTLSDESSPKEYYISIQCLPNHNNVETALNITLISKPLLESTLSSSDHKIEMKFSDLKEPYNVIHDMSYPQRIVHSLLEIHTELAQTVCDSVQQDMIVFTINEPDLKPKKFELGKKTLNYSEDGYGRKYFLSQTLKSLPRNSQTMSYLDSIQMPDWKFDYAAGEIKISPRSEDVLKAISKLDLN